MADFSSAVVSKVIVLICTRLANCRLGCAQVSFDLLLESMREGGEILRGERKPSRRFVVENKEDVQQVRRTFNLSQDTFARFMGVSVGTLRNWEQGRRHPTGAARVLLRIAIRQPKLFADAVSEDYPEMVMA